MKISIVLISKLSSEILDIRDVDVSNNLLNPVQDLHNLLHDTYGPLNKSLIVWRYSNDLYFEIDTYISYMSALNFSGEKRIYVLLKDFDDPWIDNGKYIQAIDQYEEQLLAQSRVDVYDVKLVTGSHFDSVQHEDVIADAELNVDTFRTNADVITYALRTLPESTYFTEDFTNQALLIDALKKGCVNKLKLEAPAEEVIERASAKKKKEKPAQKGKKG